MLPDTHVSSFFDLLWIHPGYLVLTPVECSTIYFVNGLNKLLNSKAQVVLNEWPFVSTYSLFFVWVLSIKVVHDADGVAIFCIMSFQLCRRVLLCTHNNSFPPLYTILCCFRKKGALSHTSPTYACMFANSHSFSSSHTRTLSSLLLCTLFYCCLSITELLIVT